MTRRGDTLLFDAPPTVAAWAAAGGKKESEGPLASAFDFVTQDAAFGEQGCENWEQAESLLQRKAVELCLRKADIPRSKVDIAFAGDLQAQLCKDCGLTLTGAGSAYPYHKDPDDSHLRIAPTYPSLTEVETASALLCVCVRLAVVEKLLADQQ